MVKKIDLRTGVKKGTYLTDNMGILTPCGIFLIVWGPILYVANEFKYTIPLWVVLIIFFFFHIHIMVMSVMMINIASDGK